MATPKYTTETHVYKRVGSLELTIDVHTPSEPSSEPRTALIWYHGGFLVRNEAAHDTRVSWSDQDLQIVGTKTSWSPTWLINASIRRGWIVATPSYRLLPEATGDEVLSDTIDAAHWVAANISSRILMTGGSAGGFLAVATAAQLTSPRPLAVLANYGMLDFSHPEYIDGSAMGAMPPLPEAVTEPVVKEIAASRGVGVIDGYAPPEDFSPDKRMLWVATIKQLALFPDIITGVPGLSQQIKKSGIEVIKPEHRKFFPLSFGLSASYPPTALVHGAADDLVEASQSTAAAEKLKAAGVEVVLVTVPGVGHGFDSADPELDVDSPKAEETEVGRALRTMVQFLDSTAAKEAA